MLSRRQIIICHVTISLGDQLNSQMCPAVRLFACSHLLQMSDTCIHLSYFIYYVAVCLCFVWIFFSSQLLSDLLASIIYCCTCCSGVSAACWSSAKVALASVEVYWSVKERGHRRAVRTCAAPWRLTVGASIGLVSMCRHSGHLRSSVGFCERKAVQCQRVLFLALLASLWQGSAQLCFLLVWKIWKCL